MMNKKLDTVAYSIMQATTWSFYAILLCFSSNFLRNFDFQDSEISLLLGVTTALSCLLQLFSAEIISRSEKFSVYKVLLGMGALMLVGTIIILNPWSNILAVLGFALSCIVFQAIPGMVNSVAMNAIEYGATTNYSIARGFGSLAYSGVAFVTGRVVMMQGIYTISVLSVVASILFIFSVIWYHKLIKQIIYGSKTNQKAKSKNANFIKQNPFFSLFLLGSIFLFISHNLVCNFMMQIIVAKGGKCVSARNGYCSCCFYRITNYVWIFSSS